jgi:superfamily II DNA/RNA helicase
MEKKWLINTMTQYRRKADHIHEILGPWASGYFIQETNTIRTGSTHASVKISSCQNENFNKILAGHFNQPGSRLVITSTIDGQFDSLSDKAFKLASFVAEQSMDTKSVIFVKERAIVSMLFYILSTHPRTANQFNFATFVGLSTNAKKSVGIHELLDTKSQTQSLEAFRTKQRQIIIATDVLEEGIDVAACNLVICFDPPSNLKSFVQRRGRARMQRSQFVIMQPCGTTKANPDRWAQIEEQMIRMCRDEERVRQTVIAVEEEDENFDLTLRVESTGYEVCMIIVNAADDE